MPTKTPTLPKNIRIKWDSFNTFHKQIKKLSKKYSNFCVITDHNIEKLYAKKFLASLKKNGIKAKCFSIPAGEASKSRNIKANLEDKLIEHSFGKDSAIIAMGGGVVGDLAGFVASTYCRGIGFIQIPTSLLSMVDSSVGGKTAISLPTAKNIIGTIYQPDLVLIDPKLLLTLEDKELLNGMVEAVKTALILDKTLFEYIDKNTEKILDLSKKEITTVIEKCIAWKADIVTKDPNENELRKILNYGHTIGHAVETLSNYQLLHGECVSIGMRYAADISVSMKLMSPATRDKQNKLLSKLKLQAFIPKNITPANILKQMKSDKKNKSGKTHFILLDKIGHVYTKNKSVTVCPSDKIVSTVLTK